jgi:DNA replication and repair protein RecF
MQITRITLRNFRSYEGVTLEPGPGVNQFVGDNAQGKTNLLEAIFLLITGRSFRTTKLSDCIRKGADSFQIEAHFIRREVAQTLSISYSDECEVRLSGNRINRSELLGLLPGVLASPEDEALIAGSPSHRRRYLDLYLAQSSPTYVHQIQRYLRALRQRNTLLRQNQLNTIEIWEEQLSSSGDQVNQMRLDAVQTLEPLATQHSEQIGSDHVELHLRPSPTTLDAYISHREREQQVGYTLIGPHRDDLYIKVNGLDARSFTSQGQKGQVALSLRLAELQRLHTSAGEAPLLLLDDIAAHLSQKRRQTLEGIVHRSGQTFITATEPLPIDGSHPFQISSGRVNPA